MITNEVNKTVLEFKETSQVRAASIIRKIKNDSGADISFFDPIVNDGWDVTDNCLKIKHPDSRTDIILGVAIDGINDGITKDVRYVSSGLIVGVDTSSWSVNDFIYAKTDATFTNNPSADEANTIPQEIGIVIRSDATDGEIYISSVASQIKYIQLAINKLQGEDAATGTGEDGDSIELIAGDGDEIGDGGNVILEPGEGGLSGEDGAVIVKQPNTVLGDNKYMASSHDGTDAIIEVLTGMLKVFGSKLRVYDAAGTNYAEMYSDGTFLYLLSNSPVVKTDNKTINLGSGICAGANANFTDLAGDQIVEVNAVDNYLKSVAKGTAYNKNFGTGSGQVAEGDHIHAEYIEGSNVLLSEVTVENTVTETTIYNAIIGANELAQGQRYKAVILGKFSTANASDTFTIKVKLGTTTLFTIPFSALYVVDTRIRVEFYLTIRSDGASGTYAAHLDASYGDEIINETPISGSVDTTAANNISMTVQWDTADLDDTMSIMQSFLEVIQ